MDGDRDRFPIFLFIGIVLLILFVGLFTPLRDRLLFRVDDLKARVFSIQNKPEESVFIPQEQQSFDGDRLSLPDLPPTQTPYPTETPTEAPTETPIETEGSVTEETAASPTETPEPLPAATNISGVRYETQHGIWNYCAPTNLSMAMTFWGWQGDRMSVGPKVKPFNKDKNVMYYELEDFVTENSDLRSVVRPGGTAELLKQLISKGFPVLVEKGSFMQEVSGKLSWMGHYNIVTGYDDDTREWIVQDSYYNADYKVTYETFEEEWKSFNYQFMVVYPGNEEGNLYQVLGPYTNSNWADQNALRMADEAVAAAETPEDYYYAYFNRGSCQVELMDYYGAAQSYDMAFTFYADIETTRRPYRMVWYQTGPYYAYYYCGRYQDIIALAEQTINSTAEPYFEETYYWRAKAYEAMGEIMKARDDLAVCLQLHKGFTACEELQYQLGGEEEE